MTVLTKMMRTGLKCLDTLRRSPNETLLARLVDKTFLNHGACIHMKSIEHNVECINVYWSDETSGKFPHIFLRDNCQCPLCFHASSQQRQLDLVANINVDIKATDVRHDTDSDTILVQWPDTHESVFKGDWLKQRVFPESWSKAQPYTLYDIKPCLWNAKSMSQNLPYVDYDDFMTSDVALLRYFENLFVHGLSILQNAPKEPGVLVQLPKRASLGYSKKTHYGVVFTVKSKPSPSNLAYTAAALPLHVDFPYFKFQPDFQCLHCIEQSEGENAGASIISDGFRAAEKLRSLQPHLFDILTKVNFKFNDVGTDKLGPFDVQHERPIIGLDSFGGLETISLNNQSRSSFINAPYEDLMDIYKAYYALTRYAYEGILEYKMRPGDIVCFNNKRVLHGRRGYDAKTTTRWLEGTYMDSDEVYSKYRTVREKMEIKSIN